MKRLTPAFVTLMMLFMVGGLVAAYFAKALWAVEDAPPEVTTRLMPMAVTDIEPGTELSAEHLGQGPMPLVDLEPNMLTSERVIVGRIAKERIHAASPLRSNQLYAPGETPPLDVPDGKRAVTILVRESAAIVNGLIRPGDFVDVQFTPTAMANDPRMHGGMTMVLFRGIRVLAINRRFQQSDVERTGNSVTIALTPKQTNVVVLAQEKGLLTMSYNKTGEGNGELAVGDEDRVTLEQILGLTPIPELAAPFQAEIFYGSGRSILHFRDGHRLGNNNIIDDPSTSPGGGRVRPTSTTPRNSRPVAPTNLPRRRSPSA